ncbi:hypothetical protein I302_101559 [Kwoniella bestiolae CBS 10118]|uniref:Major facilitator superfamily (MFS) profile domain-containing protein n=1 Tax=Kwoniella bestiolae CBS 10118 TaxID=1296100 RepID=A0A1B9GCK5_9TREE|nr:hypothetical protein I302_00242 [Kwoniella bestiolae CBS 10118]OCF28753.1 hypothetical protein I302_00242 [Kwoniella bestiolae CBS 10118]
MPSDEGIAPSHLATEPLSEITTSHTNLLEHTPSQEHSPTSKKDLHIDPHNETPIPGHELPLLALHPNPLNPDTTPPTQTRLYKRRYLVLLELSLLNIIVSWCWLTFSSVSGTSSTFYNVSESTINWLSTGFLFAFVVASPVVLWVLNRSTKMAMVVASGLLILGSWLRFLGSKLPHTDTNHRGFGVVLLGQIIIGFAQPFVLSAPTRLSHQWFGDKERITATALASLCNPLGGALGQLIGPFIATEPEKVPDMVLYVAIITTVISIPSIFLPLSPPLPPTTTPFNDTKIDLKTLKSLFSNLSFHLIAWPFIIYVASFNATSSLLNQIMSPYGFTEDQAGIDGAIMIVVGLLAAAVVSPILDRKHGIKLIVIKICVVVISIMYLLFIFLPSTRKLVGIAIISALIGSTSFILLPLALEMLADTTYPIGPEVSSTICWAISQLMGGILLVSMTALKGHKSGQPDKSMYRSLVLQAVLCCVVAPLPLCLGFWGTGRHGRDKVGQLGNGSESMDGSGLAEEVSTTA